MNIEEYREYCLKLDDVTESFPFDEYTLVFKVNNKMFALVSLNNPEFRVNLKCNPDKAVQLREEFEYVLPGYHMNKTHWNTIIADHASNKQLIEWTMDSYNMIKAKTKK